MTQIILIIIGIVIVALLLTRKGRESARQVQDKTVGICAAAIGQDVKKKENKEKVLALLTETHSTSSGQEGLSNSDIREALGISERSVVRYMDELECEGRVEQAGATGRSVVYRLKK